MNKKNVYLIEIELEDGQDVRDILAKWDPKVQIRQLASKTFEEYDYRHRDPFMGM
jgi:hypothetical protein